MRLGDFTDIKLGQQLPTASVAPCRSTVGWMRTPSAGGLDPMGVEQLIQRFEKLRASDQEMGRTQGAAATSIGRGAPGALLPGEREIAESLFEAFLDRRLAKAGKLSTGQVQEHLVQKFSASHKGLVKTLLHQACVLQRAPVPGQPSFWMLRQSLHPNWCSDYGGQPYAASSSG